jgi:choline dehydrogenase-like flavoprotein
VVLDHYVARGTHLPFAKAGTILFQLPHWNPILAASRAARSAPGQVPLWGDALALRLRDRFHAERWIEVETFAEALPWPSCHVSLDPDHRDPHGVPVARVAAAVHPASLAASDFLLERGTAILRAAGAHEVKPSDEPRTYWNLQAGTARMGRDPSRSVVDPTGQAHEVRNLYVADSSAFPSGGAAPFTLTIMANACRVAGHIVARGARGDL